MRVSQRRIQVGLIVVFTGLSLLGVGMALGVVQQAGIGWDSHFDLTTAQEFLALSPDATFGSVLASVPDQDIANGTLRFQVAQGLESLVGSGSQLDASNPSSYVMVSVVIIALATVSLFVLAVALRLVTKSWLPGAVAAALTTTLPLWVGISGVAWRDIPVAAGMTIVTSGLIFAALRGRRMLLVGGATVPLGALLAISTRAGSLALVALLVVVGMPLVLLARGESRKRSVLTAGILIGGLLGGLVLAVATHPVARLDPLRWISTAVVLASDNPNALLVKVMARDVLSSDLPLWYIPVYLLAQLPLLVLALVALSAVGLSWRTSWHVKKLRSSPVAVAALLLLTQAVVLPVALAVAGTNIYDGLRHVLFMFPASFALLGLSSWRLLGLADGKLALAFTIFVVLVPTVSLVSAWRWFPYSYAFINPVAGIVKEPRIWELDYWGLTTREAAERLRSEGFTTVGAAPSANGAIPWGVVDTTSLMDSLPQKSWGAYVFNRWGEELPDSCEELFVIERDGHVLGVAGRCSQPSLVSQ